MAYTKPTLADLKQSLADRHDNGDLPTDSATLSLWIRLFNRGVSYCINKLKITKKTTLTTASGTIAMPDDFMVINKVFDSSGNEFSQINLLDSEDVVSGEMVYWLSGDFSSGFYLNAPDDDTYTVYYTYRPSPMANDVDVCPFPDEEAIVSYAYGMLRKSESDPFEDSFEALNDCNLRLSEIERDYTLNDEQLEIKLLNNA